MSEEDAEDVVQLLHESLLDAFTTDTGEIDFGRKGGMSLAKQVHYKQKQISIQFNSTRGLLTLLSGTRYSLSH